MIEQSNYQENQPRRVEAGEVFSPSKILKDMRHNKNLHGEGKVRGLTGFYHRRYYRDGHHEPNKRKQ